MVLSSTGFLTDHFMGVHSGRGELRATVDEC